MPDGRSLVYSMQGSLWKQALDSDTAVQLTSGRRLRLPAGRVARRPHVVFMRYLGDAMELQLLDLGHRRSRRRSPTAAPSTASRAGRPTATRIAWVSTAGTGHFHVFVGHAQWQPARRAGRSGLSARALRRATTTAPSIMSCRRAGRRTARSWSTSAIPRSSTAPAPSGAARSSAMPNPAWCAQEETTWRARPDWSPDGKRIAYASYAGRNSHQIWLTTAAGNGDPLALTYGDADATGARWSADGEALAYLSNSTGDYADPRARYAGRALAGARDTRATVPASDGPACSCASRTRRVRNGADLPARVSVVAADGRAYAPDDAWMPRRRWLRSRSAALRDPLFPQPGPLTPDAAAGTSEASPSGVDSPRSSPDAKC